MSQEHSTSNPFRRKAASSSSASVALEPAPVIDDRVNQPADPARPQTIDSNKKPAKKVRVQSPHPSSPSSLETPTALASGDASIYNRVPTPSQQDDDPFESILSDTSSEASDSKASQAPPNPFKKTLDTIEPSKREAASSKPNAANSGRASLDVEAFKRLLMTGSAGPGITAPLPHLQPGLGDGGSSTDASSLSRGSVFEPIQEHHLDSPGTPHDISETEDDRRGADTIFSTDGRKKPLPPSSRHGKLIKIELRNDPPSESTIQIPDQQSSARSLLGHSESRSSTSSSAARSPNDLNKPLPSAPERTSHDSDRQSIFDIESAGKAPEPSSPPQSIRRKTPPPLPLTRRHSRRVPDSRTTRVDAERLSTSIEEAQKSTPLNVSNAGPTASESAHRNDTGRAPPPPPSRRPASIRGSVQSSSSAGSAGLPIPSSTFLTEKGSPPRERPQSMITDAGVSKRASMYPPPPPPPRHGDSSRRTSGENSRKSWDSGRKESETSSIQEDRDETRPDILADLTKLQREIDALRSKGERSLS